MTLEDFIIEDADDFLCDEEGDDSFLDECDGKGIPEFDEVGECDVDPLKECDGIPEFDEVKEDDEVVEAKKPVAAKPVNEKKNDCCPKKKSPKGETYTLSEALGKTRPVRKATPSLDELIDSICGKKVNEDIQKKAMQKVIAENEQADNITFLRAKLGEKKFKSLMESLEAGKKSMGDFKVNGKHISEFTVTEIQAILEKVNEQIKEFEEKLKADGLNEADAANINKTLNLRRVLAEKLSDELDYRNAITEAEEDAPMDPFGNVDSVPSGSEEEKSAEDDEKPAEEKKSDDEEKKDDEKNPDEDEVIELSQIVITLASKDAAEDLKNDLIDAGIPEEALTVEKASDDEDDEETSEEEKPAEDEEKPAEEEKPEEEKAEESVAANGNKLNEADDDADAPAEDDEKPAEEENADEPYKVILTDTEHVGTLANVLQDIWGMEQDEFNELIGGEIVTDDEEEKEDDADDADSQDDAPEKDPLEDLGSENSEEDDLKAEDIFKGL